ncbi:DUF4112 domain-containing protein [Jiella sp. M17.18]|uniref:DUF4112 domain-containing protein n=1 Tax=Jiella sp. M17.18 TaxID=3234247 RepID=UPI0034DF5DFB
MPDRDPFARADQMRRLRRVTRIARLMDTAIRIPGTRISFGGDSIVGLVPGIGDAGAALVSLWIVYEARRLGMPASKLAMMLGNIGFDFAVGSVPVLGDVFDVFFKSNRRNLDMILDHFGATGDEFDIDHRRPMKDITPKRR